MGEVTVATPGGPTITVKVAESNEISELIRAGLDNEKTAESMTNSLLSIIESLPPKSKLSEKLIGLVEQRKPPFSLASVPVTIEFDSNLPEKFVARCEDAPFETENIVVFLLKSDDQMVYTFNAHVDQSHSFPCPENKDILHINSVDVEKYKPISQYKVMAKGTY